MNSVLIAAIELGSHKVIGAIGRREEESIHVLGYVEQPSKGAIRMGNIYNVERAATIVAGVIEALQHQYPSTIEQIYICHNGRSLRSSLSSVERQFDDTTPIATDIVSSMMEEAERQELEHQMRLILYPQEYVIDHKSATEIDPIGVSCRHIKGNYLSIYLNEQVSLAIDRTFERASTIIADSYISILNLGDMLLTDDERKRGSMLLDFGADTLSIAIYKRGYLRFLRVLPLGSALITSDLANVLKISEEAAEELKKTYGLCHHNKMQNLNEKIEVEGKSVALKEIDEIIDARQEEILRNMVSQVKASGFGEVLYAGMVLTGGGSNLKGLSCSLQKHLPNIPILRFVREFPMEVSWADSLYKRCDGTQLSLLSLLKEGVENCCKVIDYDIIDNVSKEQESAIEQRELFTSDGESAQERIDKEENQRREETYKESLSTNDEDETLPDREKKRRSKRSYNSLQSAVDRVKSYITTTVVNTMSNIFDEEEQDSDVEE